MDGLVYSVQHRTLQWILQTWVSPNVGSGLTYVLRTTCTHKLLYTHIIIPYHIHIAIVGSRNYYPGRMFVFSISSVYIMFVDYKVLKGDVAKLHLFLYYIIYGIHVTKHFHKYSHTLFSFNKGVNGQIIYIF